MSCFPPQAAADETTTESSASDFAAKAVPFLEKYCASCHSGSDAEGMVRLDQFAESADVQNHFELWEKVILVLREQQMPPIDADQPETAERVAALQAVSQELDAFDCGAGSRPGRVTIQRLNRVEYNNTIRDLVGLDFQPAKDFPSDDVGNGFDNIGDVLTLPPILMEKYLDAARDIAARVFADENARKRVLIHTAAGDSIEEKVEVARRNVDEFASRAFRRPVTQAESDRLFRIMTLAYNADSQENEIFQTVVTAVLVSPHFIYRVELDANSEATDGVRPLNDFELASRLSYFLWSSMPDEQLFERARRGELHTREAVAEEATRMLNDPKSRALVENFAGQWLQLRDLDRLTPDRELFPDFNDSLRQAMRKESEMLFESLIREDRSVLELLTADYTFLNEALAGHYRIEGVTGDEFRKVPLTGARRGILTQGSILLLTSNPTRTSPVKRGKWILDNLLGEPPPPPPPNVPELEAGAEALGTLRERMEQHRSNPACAVCHTKMDAIGFGLENFDAAGAWRDRDGRSEIDPAGSLPGGRTFAGPVELITILAEEKKTEFCRCMTQKLLTYALGRGLQPFDRCTVKQIVRQLSENDYRFGILVREIVTSGPFMTQEIEGSR
ncbi:MAG: DUF1592 domain-containing protein [Planctomycetaceae bacterium]